MKKSLIRTLLILILIGVIGVFAVIFVKPSLISSSKSSEAALVHDRIVELSEWTTLKYEYSNVIVSRNSRNISLIGLTEVKLAEAIKLIEYSGYLKAGTDLSKLQVTYNDETEKMLVKVPKSTILDNVADTDTMKITDIKGNIFSDYSSQQIIDDINKEKEDIEKQKIDQGFLDEADKRIQELLTTFLKTNGYENVTIEFF